MISGLRAPFHNDNRTMRVEGSFRDRLQQVGFSDVERHALNTVFRLSEARRTAYALWVESAPDAAEIALIDSDSCEAALELANPAHDSPKLIWVGDKAPARASS